MTNQTICLKIMNVNVKNIPADISGQIYIE